MTATQRWIKDMLDGGWNPMPQYYSPWWNTLNDQGITMSGGEGDQERYTTYRLLLDPLAWQAVGKTRGWNIVDNPHHERFAKDKWKIMWNIFIDHLKENKTIDEALQAIE